MLVSIRKTVTESIIHKNTHLSRESGERLVTESYESYFNQNTQDIYKLCVQMKMINATSHLECGSNTCKDEIVKKFFVLVIIVCVVFV